MKTGALFAVFLTVAQPAWAWIDVRLSVKYIQRHSDGAMPQYDGVMGADISSGPMFNAEVAVANQALATSGSPYRLRVVQHVAIRPAAPPGKASDYWYELPARENRALFEAAALASPSTWQWDTAALNIFVNNTASGQCSFGGTGASISLGADVSAGTVLHEIGHFFDLRHTHAGDPACADFTATSPLSQHVTDGDGLGSTAADHPCLNLDELSQALFGMGNVYAGLAPFQQRTVESAFRNVMSYHTGATLATAFGTARPILLNADQMDTWADTARLPERNASVSGLALYVDKTNPCLALDQLPNDYRWWAERNPPLFKWGSSKPLVVSLDPPTPPAPPDWPSDWAWPPNLAGPRPPAPFYPANWSWPPFNPPSAEFCLGGPRKTLRDALAQANPGDAVVLRPGSYMEATPGQPLRLTKRMTILSTRGTATIGR